MSIIPNYSKRVKLPKYIYHVTNYSNLTKIKKQGLLPNETTQRTYSKPAIFFTSNKKDIPNLINTLGKQEITTLDNLMSDYYDNVNNNEEYLIITIDTKHLPNKYKFYNDTNYGIGKGYFTYSPIPSKYLKLKKW